jgi:D-inositol-3-phosphate glycosyltransferase
MISNRRRNRQRDARPVAKRLAIYHPNAKLGLGENPFGKDVANIGLYRSVARYGGYDPLAIVAHGVLSEEALTAGFNPDGDATSRLAGVHMLNQQGVAKCGAVLHGFPRLRDLAWLRRRLVGDGAYSLIGMVHTLAPPVLREEIAAHALAPLHAWDALICTSPSVQSALVQMYAEQAEYLADRFGATRNVRPHLPLLPLGVDGDRFAALANRPDVRARRRAEMGIGADDIVILWVGRLSFFEKAFPQSMFQAAQAAVEATGATVHYVQAGWFPGAERDETAYAAAARYYAPNVRVHVADGNDQDRLGELWAVADIFISLVDNIQETFGITPVEAMAAGLPVVVSDWDGYRFTIEDGVQGFRIPTLGGPLDGIGARMALSHVAMLESYQTYVGAIAQHTAVHVGKAAQALTDLVRSPELRRRMGAAGRERVRATFDWPVIAKGVDSLVDELAVRREEGLASARPAGGLQPSKGDPFRDFAGFPTAVLDNDTVLTVAAGKTAADLAASQTLGLDTAFSGYRAKPDEIAQAFELIASGACRTVGEVLACTAEPRRGAMQLGLMWMCKRGLLDWLQETP